ncbi:unnamed protein product [Rotaria magnacalcarata]|uniref:Uncharacterized protein n=1 Tax=Rotaria magnacalcarata TaxID=392030 RepID=A0A819JV35_9BILA|nr:unnamed protein product [Rotaria magnacalcarata]CAF2126746.1 unnamed protein product [Rotaria magnacalcarata]CAF3938800.1 unnamed protein product [Rotaria magnacalcarata]CAF4093517.1 unnamed protein product [Rotaria magnacalcarata]
MNTFKRKTRQKLDNSLSNINKEDSTNSNLDINNKLSFPSISYQMNHRSSSIFPYLQNEYIVLIHSFVQCNIGELIRQPEGVDQNEWIAINIVSFFNHINILYGAISHLCTTTTCPIMIGPQNSLYYWIDERGKKVKYSASQYIELAITFIQKNLSNEAIFPTRFDNKFPPTFMILIRKIVRLLFHCLSHIYAVHYNELIEYELHPHLNSLFLHLISFIIKSDIIPFDCSNSLIVSSQIEIREFQTELESLSILYELLSKQWQHIYAQMSAQKRKISNK